MNQFLVLKNDERKISNILRTNGYYFSKLNTSLIKNENNTVNLIFNIDLGEKAFIKKISFIGDKKIKDSKLRKIIISEEAKRCQEDALRRQSDERIL